jgi:hypothetical protein
MGISPVDSRNCWTTLSRCCAALLLASSPAVAAVPATAAPVPADQGQPATHEAGETGKTGIAGFLEKGRVAAGHVVFGLHRADAYCALAEAQIAANDLEGARANLISARKMVNLERLIELQPLCHVKVAGIQVQAHDRIAAAATLKQAHDAANRIQHPRERAIDLARVALAQAQMEDRDAATGTFADAIRAADAEPKSDAFKGDTYCWVAVALAQSGDLEMSRRTMERVEDEFNRSGGFQRIAVALAEAADTRNALEMSKQIRPTIDTVNGPRQHFLLVEAYDAIAIAQAKAGDMAAAERTIALIDASSDKQQVWIGIAAFQARAGNIPAARASVAKLDGPPGNTWRMVQATSDVFRYPFGKADVLAEIAAAQARAHDPAGAKATAAEALRQVPGSNFPLLEASSYCRIAAAQAAAGDAGGAKESFALSRAAADKLLADDQYDALRKWAAMRAIAAAQAEAGELESAQATADAIGDDEAQAHACFAIAAVRARRGELDELRRWIDSLKSPMAQAYACAGAATALAAVQEKPETVRN